MTCCYFYLWEEDFGPAFVRVCACPAKVWVNGHEWARRQALRAGIGFTELASGFASCDDPAGLREICDRFQAGTVEVFARRWLRRIPVPFGPAGRDAGYWRECSMRQVEVSRTVVFDEPCRARLFFEALIAGNLDLGRPENVEVIFGRRVRVDTPGTFRTVIGRPVIDPDDKGVAVNVFCRHSRVRQYLREGRALRIETVIRRRPHRRLPRRKTPTPAQAPGREQGQARGRPLRPRDHLAPAVRPSARFRDLGPGWHDRKADRDRKIRARLRQLQARGLDVTITPAA